MNSLLPNPFLASGPVGAPEPFHQIVSELEAALADNNRFVLDEVAFMEAIEERPLFLRGAAA